MLLLIQRAGLTGVMTVKKKKSSGQKVLGKRHGVMLLLDHHQGSKLKPQAGHADCQRIEADHLIEILTRSATTLLVQQQTAQPFSRLHHLLQPPLRGGGLAIPFH